MGDKVQVPKGQYIIFQICYWACVAIGVITTIRGVFWLFS